MLNVSIQGSTIRFVLIIIVLHRVKEDGAVDLSTLKDGLPEQEGL